MLALFRKANFCPVHADTQYYSVLYITKVSLQINAPQFVPAVERLPTIKETALHVPHPDVRFVRRADILRVTIHVWFYPKWYLLQGLLIPYPIFPMQNKSIRCNRIFNTWKLNEVVIFPKQMRFSLRLPNFMPNNWEHDLFF